MADHSSIEWTDSTFNPWIGCTKVSPGCDHCYAERDMDHRRGRARWGAGQPRSRTSADYWRQPLRWNSKRFMACRECGWRGECAAELIGCGRCGSSSSMQDARRRVFCASLADVFDNEVDPAWRRDLFDLIRATPHLDWLLLTKRIGIAQRLFDECHDYLSDAIERFTWPANVWLGATVVSQEEVDRDVPKLLKIPARVRFLSIEPMLGHVMLLSRGFLGSRFGAPGVSWVIAGGESGPGARPMHPGWVRSLRDQCAFAGVPFLFKQWGEWVSVSEVAGPGAHFSFPDGATVRRTGKKNAGRLLDGAQHDGFPA